MNINSIVQPATKDGGFFHFIRGWVVMFNVSKRPYRYHVDVRFSLIADKGRDVSVRFVPEADIGTVRLLLKDEPCVVITQPHQICENQGK